MNITHCLGFFLAIYLGPRIINMGMTNPFLPRLSLCEWTFHAERGRVGKTDLFRSLRETETNGEADTCLYMLFQGWLFVSLLKIYKQLMLVLNKENKHIVTWPVHITRQKLRWGKGALFHLTNLRKTARRWVKGRLLHGQSERHYTLPATELQGSSSSLLLSNQDGIVSTVLRWLR